MDKDTTLTQEQVTKAFENWENDCRQNPHEFLTAEEVASLEVSSISENRAVWLFAYARQQSPSSSSD